MAASLKSAIVDTEIDPAEWSAKIQSPECGGVVTFEGRVRDHNDGHLVDGLTYQAYEAMAEKELHRILQDMAKQFPVHHLAAVHRHGQLAIGDVAVWVGAASPHRAEAFDAVRRTISEIKQRLPIWKCEHYRDGKREWIQCHHTH